MDKSQFYKQVFTQWQPLLIQKGTYKIKYAIFCKKNAPFTYFLVFFLLKSSNLFSEFIF